MNTQNNNMNGEMVMHLPKALADDMRFVQQLSLKNKLYIYSKICFVAPKCSQIDCDKSAHLKDKNSDCYECDGSNCNSSCLHKHYWNSCDECFQKSCGDDADSDEEDYESTTEYARNKPCECGCGYRGGTCETQSKINEEKYA